MAGGAKGAGSALAAAIDRGRALFEAEDAVDRRKAEHARKEREARVEAARLDREERVAEQRARGIDASGGPVPPVEWARRVAGQDPFAQAEALRAEKGWGLGQLQLYLRDAGVPLAQRCEWLAGNVAAEGLTPEMIRVRAVHLADVLRLGGAR